MPGDELPDSVNRTPTHTACTDAHRVSAHHTAQSDHFSSREHAWLTFKVLCVKNILSSTCHVSFLAAPDTDHQHKFSLPYLSNLTVVLSHTHKLVDARSIHTLRRFTAAWRIFGNPISHRFFEPKRIELDTLLDRNLEVEHQDLTQDRIMGDDYQNPITEDTDEFGKIGVKSLSYNQSQIHSD